jgi:hypothetical protein
VPPSISFEEVNLDGGARQGAPPQ